MQVLLILHNSERMEAGLQPY